MPGSLPCSLVLDIPNDSHSLMQPVTRLQAITDNSICGTSHTTYMQNVIHSEAFGFLDFSGFKSLVSFVYARRTADSDQLHIPGNLLVKDRAECDRLN